MSEPLRPGFELMRQREDRAQRQLLADLGVTPEQFEAGGPDGQELPELIWAPVEVWNAFGLISQEWDSDDELVHRRLVKQFELVANGPGDDPDFGWTLHHRLL